MLFSQRNGYIAVRSAIQTEDLDKETRNALWNLISEFFQDYAQFCSVYENIWTEVFHETRDTRPVAASSYSDDNEHFYAYYKKCFLEDKFYRCFDLIEYLCDASNRYVWYEELQRRAYCYSRDVIPAAANFNCVFERYLVGYRIVNGMVSKVSSAEEVNAIESALERCKDSVREELSKALKFLSDRRHPDYAKSIACSISAVEAQCRIILQDPQPTLGQALKKLESKGVEIHGSLKSAFEKLYGYTSDGGNIRHGTIDPSNADQKLAMFMLVSCSAFINYLIAASK